MPPAKGNTLYQLTAGDLKIFDKVRRTGNLNWFTNYYLRREDSGTWWKPVVQDELDKIEVPEFMEMALRWRDGYEHLFKTWYEMGKPEFFVETAPQEYEIITFEQHNEIFDRRKYRTVHEIEFDRPVFHHNHGFIMLPWALETCQAPQEERVIIGGYGSGKTLNLTAEALVYAAMLKSFRCFMLAPFSLQANEIYAKAKELIEGTLYDERFLLRAPRKPMNHLVIGNSLVGGDNLIECYPILDDPGKIKNLSGDMAIIDQAEMLPEIEELRGFLGSRFRGQVGGRARLGKTSYIANVADNPALWDLYDEAETDPDSVYSVSPHSGLNFYLTIKDMIRYQKRVGKTAEERRMFFAGGRPLGSGQHFSKEALEKSRAHWLDELMEQHLAAETEGWRMYRAHKCGTVKWEMPHDWDKDPHAQFIVVADPGTKNPPYRDSAGISVWNITGFPAIPATMVAFSWVAGNTSPHPWMNQFTDYVMRYRAIGHNAYDATGNGAFYTHISDISDLLPYPVNLGGGKKQAYVTLAQHVMNAGKLKMPYIEHLFSQLAKYDYAQDKAEKLRQDLVMMMLVLIAMLEQYWYTETETKDSKPEGYDPDDRYSRPEETDRYSAYRDVA